MTNANGHRPTGAAGASTLLGVVLVGLGALFLAARVFGFSLIGYLWPFFIIVPGVLCFVAMVIAGKEHAKAFGLLSIPGAIVTMTGLLLLYQNTFDHWESWAYAWALVMPTSIGIGLAIYGSWIEDQKLVNRALQITMFGFGGFLVMGAFFELVLNISDSLVSTIIWPALLILGGLYLIRRRQANGDSGDRVKQPVTVEKVVEAPPRPIETPQPAGPEFEPIDLNRGKQG